MDLALKDKVVLVTGASGGIGSALAEGFAAEGAKLVLHAGSKLAELERWIAAQPWRERALAVQAEISDCASVERMFAAAATKFGRVDCVIANAGRWTPEFALVHQASEARIRSNLETNLFGALWTARAFLATLARTGPRADGAGASLVLIGSTAGRFGEKGHAEYAVGKAGLYGILTSIKNEIVALDPFARVNLIEPGWTVTRMALPSLEQPGVITAVVRTMPLRQLARPEDIARAALFLCSPAAARHVSGQVLTVAGGMEGRVQWETREVDESAVRARLSQ
jgi:3-oxoacyl-[acyl-carrier protein] reductase